MASGGDFETRVFARARRGCSGGDPVLRHVRLPASRSFQSILRIRMGELSRSLTCVQFLSGADYSLYFDASTGADCGEMLLTGKYRPAW